MAAPKKIPPTLFQRLKGVFLGPGSLTDFGERFLILDGQRQTSVKGMYAIGDVTGTPDIKAALVAGTELGEILGTLPRRSQDKTEFDVAVIGAGPAGVACALALQKVGRKVVVIERKRMFQTIRQFASSKALFLASTGPKGLKGPLSFVDGTAAGCIETWEAELGAGLDLHENEEVTEIKRRGAFEVWTRSKEGPQTYLADRVVVAVGKPRVLQRLSLEGATEQRVRYQLRYSGGVEDKDVLVVGDSSCHEGFEMALDLAPNNRVTIIQECAEYPAISEGLVKRLNQAIEAKRLSFLSGTKLLEIKDGEVVLETSRGGSSTESSISNDLIFSGKIIDREMPVTDLQNFGLTVERRMSPWKYAAAMVLFAFFAFVYMGKSGKAELLLPAFKQVRLGLEASFGGLYMYQLWTMVYSFAIVGFGFKAIYKYRTQFRDADQGHHQTKRLLSLMVFQVFFLAILPELILKNWRAYGLVLAWPLNLKPDSYEGFISNYGWVNGVWTEQKPLLSLWGLDFGPNRLYLVWTIFLTIVLIPLLVWRRGMSYCTWICSCGGLAETVGDDWRQFSPKGPANTKRERLIYVVLGATGVIMMLTVLKHHGLTPTATAGLIAGLVKGWSWVVDLFMCGIIPLVLYPYLGGRTWCRFACPTAGFMKLIGRKVTSFGIQPDKTRCIACGNCDRFCEVGVPIRKHALKGKFFSVNDTTCISCGVCISVCPTDVLSFMPPPGKRQLPMAV